MLLSGRLKQTSLGDVLGTLYRGRATGVLELSELKTRAGMCVAGRIHRVHLLSGLVASVETAFGVPPLGEILRRSGDIDGAGVTSMLDRMRLGDPRPSGAILVGLGIATPDAVVCALRKQHKVKLDVLFGELSDARIAFRASRPMGRDALRIGTLLPRDFLFGRPRARDRQSEQTPTPPPESHARARKTDGSSRTPVAPKVLGRDRALRTLGLPRDADEDTVRKTFRKLAAELHPDKHLTSPPPLREAHAARFAALSEAYHLLVA